MQSLQCNLNGIYVLCVPERELKFKRAMCADYDREPGRRNVLLLELPPDTSDDTLGIVLIGCNEGEYGHVIVCPRLGYVFCVSDFNERGRRGDCHTLITLAAGNLGN